MRLILLHVLIIWWNAQLRLVSSYFYCELIRLHFSIIWRSSWLRLVLVDFCSFLCLISSLVLIIWWISRLCLVLYVYLFGNAHWILYLCFCLRIVSSCVHQIYVVLDNLMKCSIAFTFKLLLLCSIRLHFSINWRNTWLRLVLIDFCSFLRQIRLRVLIIWSICLLRLVLYVYLSPDTLRVLYYAFICGLCVVVHI